LPPRRLQRDSLGVCLHGKNLMRPSPFVWSRGDPVGSERMIGMWFRSGQVGGPSRVQIIQSDAPVGRRPLQPLYQGRRCSLCVCNEPWWGSPAHGSNMNFCWRSHAGENQWLWSAKQSSPCASMPGIIH
jgi:hypothetical protein